MPSPGVMGTADPLSALLLKYPQITVSATARSQLAAGRVDSRLLLALALLAGREPVDIVRFGNPGPGAGPGVPLRFADLAEGVPAAHLGRTAYARAVWAVLSGVDAHIPAPAGEAVRPHDVRLGTAQAGHGGSQAAGHKAGLRVSLMSNVNHIA